MPRSSKHKSHKQSKHGSKEARGHSDSEEDVKTGRSSKGDVSPRVLKDSGHSTSGEKRRRASQSREGRDGKDLVGYGNGNVSEEYTSSKRRRKEKSEGSGGSDRWNSGADERGDNWEINKESGAENLKSAQEKGLKHRESKSSGELKSKSSRRHESGCVERKDENAAAETEEEARSGRVESKRKSEKDSSRKENKDSKEKERGSEKDKKQSSKLDTELKGYNGDLQKKLGSQSVVSEEKQGKRSRDNADLSRQSKVDNCDLDKEVEKKSRKRRETSVDRDKYEDDITEIDKRRSSSRSERTKDDKYIDVKHKDGSYGDKYREDSYRDDRHEDEKYWDDKDKDSRRTEDKYYEDDRHRSDKYCEDVDIDNRYKDDKFHQGDDRDYGHRDPKYLDEIERVSRRRDDKYREDSGRDGRHWDDRYQEEGGKDVRYNDDRYREDCERDGRQSDNKDREDGERDDRRKEEKHREDSELDSRHRGDKQKDEANRHKRNRDMKYRDESMLRDRPGDRSDAKRLRDENYSTDSISRKSGLGESSPSYDIRISKYKDEQGRRRNNDKDYGDIKSQSCKDQRYDAEKISASGSRLDSISSRGKSSSRVTDLELSSNDSKKRSPASTGHYATRDHYRHLKQDESTNKDYAYQEKGNNYLGDGFAGGYLKSDSHTSLLQTIDKSPSLTSNGRRHVNRFDVRQCLDAEDPTQRSVGSRDLKDFSGKEGKGSRELPIEAPVGDELSQADGDTLSVSSPFIRGGNLSSATKSSLPPPVRSGVDSPFGFSEDDSRGKPSNRHRRTSDPSIGRFQGNSWKGVTNWSSPVNGYMPFQHGPPPVGFPPMMQQFPGPPMFGIRTPMEMSHPGLPYHLSNADRYTGHGHPIGWRIPMNDSCGPSLHAWDSTNPGFGDEAQFYGRPDWDQYTTMSRSRSWETNDMWKGPNGSASVEPPSASQKEDNSAQGLGDDSLTGQSALHVQGEQRQPDLEVESKAISQSSEAVEKNTPEGPKTSGKEASSQSKLSRRGGPHYCHAYLSKLDISADLTEPELYNQCTSLLLTNQNMLTDDASKILFVEAVEARLSRPSEISSASLFAAMSDSVLQKSISLYKKERQEIKVISGEKVLCSNALGTGDTYTTNHQIEDLMVVDIVKKPEQAIYVVDTEGMDVDVGSNPTDENDTENSSAENVEGSVEPISDLSKNITRVSNDLDNPSPNRKEGNKLFDAKCGPLVCPDVSPEASEVLVPLSIESGSVNLSRIHHSPEIKH